MRVFTHQSLEQGHENMILGNAGDDVRVKFLRFPAVALVTGFVRGHRLRRAFRAAAAGHKKDQQRHRDEEAHPAATTEITLCFRLHAQSSELL